MWLTRNMYKKLPTDVKFELAPINAEELQRRYAVFEVTLNSRRTDTPAEVSALNLLRQKSSAMYTNAF